MPRSVKGVLNEYARGALHSGSSSGPVVKNPRQALAIALSEQRQQAAKPVQHRGKNLGKFLHARKAR